jgi:hypothetical protein
MYGTVKCLPMSQELDQRQLAKPIEVVDHDRATGSGGEIKEPL